MTSPHALTGMVFTRRLYNLSETLPEARQIALKEKPQSFIAYLGKALDRLVDTYSRERNIHREKARMHLETSVSGEFSPGVPGVIPSLREMKNAQENNQWEEKTEYLVRPRSPSYPYQNCNKNCGELKNSDNIS